MESFVLVEIMEHIQELKNEQPDEPVIYKTRYSAAP
jgi:hypothetical protein